LTFAMVFGDVAVLLRWQRWTSFKAILPIANFFTIV
jgi:hypothetical protein